MDQLEASMAELSAMLEISDCLQAFTQLLHVYCRKEFQCTSAAKDKSSTAYTVDAAWISLPRWASMPCKP